MITIKTKDDVTIAFYKQTSDDITIPEGLSLNSKVIGILSNIQEWQAKDLVQVKAGEVYFIHGEDFPLTHVNKLFQVAEMIGIKEEDFDKYLVIKL
jgi:hypothetical protein